MTEAGIFDCSDGLLKILFCFTRKAYDHIGGEVKIGMLHAKLLHYIHEGTGGIHSTHFFQYGIGSTLYAEMKMRGHFGMLEYLWKVGSKTIGLNGGDPNTKIAG